MDIDLAELLHYFGGAIVQADLRAAAAERVHADMSAACQQAGTPPPALADVTAALHGLTPEERGRAVLALSALKLPAVQAALAAGVTTVIARCVQLARATPLLTGRLLRQSVLRREEFARQLIDRLGATVAGEAAEQAQRELTRLDYGRIVAEAERAKAAADRQLDWLRKLQEEQDRRRPRPRGKWW